MPGAWAQIGDCVWSEGAYELNRTLRDQCRNLLEMWLAQIKNRQPMSPFLINREFEATLEHVCARLQSGDELNTSFTEEPAMVELIVSGNPDAGGDAFSLLRKWLGGAEEVAICDPYLLQFRPTAMFANVEAYVRALKGIFPQSVKRLDLYTNGWANAVRTPVLDALKDGRRVRHFSSDDLHDRFIIKDRQTAKAMGTSFGGFGAKFFALLDLSPRDAVEVRSELSRLCPFPVQLNRG